MAETKSYIDNGKRGRLLFFAILIGLSLFVIRAWELVNVQSNRELFSMAGLYFAITYFGLIALFKLQVNRKSLLLVIPQSSLFVSSMVLFVMMFFFRDFQRIMDFFFLIILLIALVAITYVNFLMTNVFNVASFKRIPLVQVASTASFIETVVTFFLVTFAITSLDINIGVALLTVFLAYIFISIYHYVHILNTIPDILRNAVIIAFVATSSLIPVLILGPHQELSALVPSSIAFSLIGLQMVSDKSDIKKSLIAQYFLVVVAAFLVNLLINRV